VRVLGLDPGTATTGYGVVESKGSRLYYVAHGTICTPPHLNFAERLKCIHEEATSLLVSFSPDVVAIEKLFFKQNVTNGITVAQARGVLALAAVQAGKPVTEFSPTQCKTAITGYGKADKKQMQEMIRILLNLKDLPRPDDAADALGIAICQIHAGRLPVLEGERK
jgi:crossover junction endodeoxyribonuclease RuvC